jgi:hypothetical protein
MAGTLTITTPATDSLAGYSTSSIAIVWSFTGTAGATQTQRRVTATPVGSGTATYDTGMAASTATTQTVPGFATGVSYNVVVSVIDTAGATISATRVVVSNYTRPLPPVLTIDPQEQGPVVTVTNPSDGSRPLVTQNDIYRRTAGSSASWTYLGYVGRNSSFNDYTAGASRDFEYFARANGQVDSPIVQVTTAPMLGAWVHESGDTAGTTLAHYIYATAATEAVDLEGAFHSFVGRTYAVQETGVARSDVLTIALRLTPAARYAAEDTWRDWKRRAPVLIYRDGRGRSWPVGIDGPVTLAPDGDGATINATLRRVDTVVSTIPSGAYAYTTNVDGGYGVGGYGTSGYGL